MRDREEEIQRALDPLWFFALGLLIALLLTIPGPLLYPARLALLSLMAGILALAAVSILPRRTLPLLLLGVGLLLGISRGIATRGKLEEIQEFTADSEAALRIEAIVEEGWTDSTWGFRSRLRMLDAWHGEERLKLPRSCRVEIRSRKIDELPAPGQRIESLARLRGAPERPMLLIASTGMIQRIGLPAGFPAWRERLARHLLDAAGHRLSRIRAAELAAALALGRRDFMPRESLDAWRRGGAAHVLAVSGLHVGIISGLLWIFGILLRLRPNNRRILIIPLIVGYTLLAGASASAMRACLMISLYLLARLLGRVVLPMATILLAAIILLLWNPMLLFQAGFQLTIVITAALIRWLPPSIDRLPLPRFLGAALALPFLAQAAALPLVALHFRALSPLAGVVNLAVPLLLSPTIPLSAAAVLFAGIFPSLSAHLLDLISLLSTAFYSLAALGRNWLYIPPKPSALLLGLLLFSGVLALRYDRLGRRAAASVVLLIALLPLGWFLRREPPPNSVDVLPVSDGTAVLLNTFSTHVLFDGGRLESEAAEELADAGIRSLDAVILSHADGDHIGGIARVLEAYPARELIIPRWLMDDPRVVPLLSRARNRKCEIIPLVQGLVVQVGDLRLETLWPPFHARSESDNDRSLVIRADWKAGSILLTGDISRSVDFPLLRRGDLHSEILLVAHHGSRGSTSEAFLDTVRPSIALIPAGARNFHHHPHTRILRMLQGRRIPFRYPARDGICGAHLVKGRWRAFP